MKKNYEIKVHYDVCFTVNVESENANLAVQKAINIAADKDLNDGEITDVEAYISDPNAE